MLKTVIFRNSFLLITVNKIYRANIKMERMIRISPELVPSMNISLKMMFIFICSPTNPKHAFGVSSEAHFCYLKVTCQLWLLSSSICYLGYQSSLPPINSIVANQRLGHRTHVKVHIERNQWLQISWSMVQCGQDRREDLDKNPSNVRILLQGYKKKIL